MANLDNNIEDEVNRPTQNNRRVDAPRKSSRPTHARGQRKPPKKFNGMHRRRSRRASW